MQVNIRACASSDGATAGFRFQNKAIWACMPVCFSDYQFNNTRYVSWAGSKVLSVVRVANLLRWHIGGGPEMLT